MDTDSMTVKELKQELKSRGLKVSGNKAELIERLNEAMENETTTASNDDNHDATIADFENFINDEYKRLNYTGDLDHIINEHADDAEPDQEAPETADNEKDELLTTGTTTTANGIAADFDDLPATNTQSKIIFDFDDEVPVSATATATANKLALSSEDSNALNHKSKVQDRINRFGAESYTASADKMESRKRRFAAMQNKQIQNGKSSPPPPKKQRVDVEAERQKMIERAKKFGTAFPKNIKLTKEECAVVYKTQIERAKRFGTEHLLPSTVINAEMNAKKAERMKRFNTNEKGKMLDEDGNEVAAVKTTAKSAQKVDIIKAEQEAKSSTKLMERKLRFGTLDKNNDGNDNELPQRKKKQPNALRQARNDQRFQRFRQYKKENRQFGGYQGRYASRSSRGGYRVGYSNRGGYRQQQQQQQRGGSGYYRNQKQQGQRAQQQQQQHTAVKFSGADQEKINQRKMRFNQVSDF